MNEVLQQKIQIEKHITSLTKQLDKLAEHPRHKNAPIMQPALTNSPYEIGQKNCISSNFNKSMTYSANMKSYLCDLPKRLGLERWIAHYQRKLYAMQKESFAPSFALAS